MQEVLIAIYCNIGNVDLQYSIGKMCWLAISVGNVLQAMLQAGWSSSHTMAQCLRYLVRKLATPIQY